MAWRHVLTVSVGLVFSMTAGVQPAVAQTSPSDPSDSGLTPTPLEPPPAPPDPYEPELPPPAPPTARLPAVQPPAPSTDELPEQPVPPEPMLPESVPAYPAPPAPIAPAPFAPAPPFSNGAYPIPDRGVTHSPSVIADCLCAGRRTAALRQQADKAEQSYTDAKQRLASLNDQLDRSRASVNSDDPDQVDAYRRLLLQSEESNARLFNDILPRTQRVIGRYNAEVRNYNARCTGQRFDSAVVAAVTPTLSCP